MADDEGLPPGLEHRATRMALLEYVIGKRCGNLEYLRTVFECDDEDGVMWMGVVQLTRVQLKAHFTEWSKPRLTQWLCLGLSLSGLLSQPNGLGFVAAVERMLDEFEYHYSSGMGRILKGLNKPKNAVAAGQGEEPPPAASAGEAKPSATHSDPHERGPPPASPTDGGAQPSPKHAVPGKGAAGQKTSAYQYLTLPNTPLDLALKEIVVSLCSCLSFVYRKLLDPDCVESTQCLTRIMAIDKRVEQIVFEVLSAELETLAMKQVTASQQSLANLFSTFAVDSKDALAFNAAPGESFPAPDYNALCASDDEDGAGRERASNGGLII
eukprot:TRINITY_DN8803_c0_g1_i2.p1 TRINITY_DN8803_c0_g1~~TRINITY_DN8803_c0_g1_i2.p1  ORF type:complete len:325 (+),score=95.08 TRINITY_DN8803_c0_g1_i2:52-1026(+)